MAIPMIKRTVTFLLRIILYKINPFSASTTMNIFGVNCSFVFGKILHANFTWKLCIFLPLSKRKFFNLSSILQCKAIIILDLMQIFCHTHHINEYELKEGQKNLQAIILYLLLSHIRLCDNCNKTLALCFITA